MLIFYHFIKPTMSKIMRLIIFGLIGINIFFASWYILHGDLLFHTDIARDFLLLEDIVKNKPITLIGPHCGGIPGVFHGPLWLYLNLPAYLLGKADPVYVGWFWFILYILLSVITYKTADKLFDKNVGLVSVLLISLLSANSVRNLFNPFGALILSPIFLLIFSRYVKKQQLADLVISLFILGLIIQFQIAFGVPILFLTTIYLAVFLYKKKKLKHFLAYFILLIPLSTYILFELKHNFLQIQSVIKFVSSKKELAGDKPFLVFIVERLKGALVTGWKLLPIENWWLSLPVTFFLLYSFSKIYKNKRLPSRNVLLLFLYFYGGFWALTFLFRGVIWDYYYWPFLPLAAIFLSSTFKFVNKKIFYIVLVYILVINYLYQINMIKKSRVEIGPDGGAWQFNLRMAKEIFIDAKKDFGFYIYTPDLFGYPARYTLNYAQSLFKNKRAFPFEKKATTYLLIALPPDDKPYLNGDWWRSNQVKIIKRPEKIFKYKNGFKVEKYLLNEDEIKIQSDPNLLQTIHFR